MGAQVSGKDSRAGCPPASTRLCTLSGEKLTNSVIPVYPAAVLLLEMGSQSSGANENGPQALTRLSFLCQRGEK